MDVIEQRRKARQAIDVAEQRMIETDRAMRSHQSRRGGTEVPPMTPPPAAVEANPQRLIELDVTWVGEALEWQRGDGWRACLEVFRPLLDYANATPDWRAAFDESVTDERLREILVTALDQL